MRPLSRPVALLPALLVPVLLLVSAAASLAISPLGARHPALSPEGSRLAFDWRGDVWIVDAGGGRAERLTDHVSHDAYPRWSPDGREIAFSSDRHGNNDIFVVAVDGGTPERLTFHSDWDRMCDWSHDGRQLLFRSRRESRFDLIYSVRRQGGRPVRVIGDRALNVAASPDGAWLAYVRGGNRWWRKHYRGSASRDIWVRATGGGESWHIVAWEGDDDQVHWSADSRALYFQSEHDDGVMNLYRQDLAFDGNRVSAAGAPLQLTHLEGDGLQYLSVSRDGQWASFESEGGLFVVATSGGEPRRQEIDCPGDLKSNPVEHSIRSRGATEFAFNPGEKDVAFIVEGEIYAARVKDDELKDPRRLTETAAREKNLSWLGEHTLIYASDRHDNDDIFLVRSTDPEKPRLSGSRRREEVRLTDSPASEWDPQVSPDGEMILYRHATGSLWVMTSEGANQRQIDDDPGVLHASWSPDSRYVAFSTPTLAHTEDIYINELATGRTINVSNHPNDDFHPLWTGDGKRLSWASRTDDGYYNIKYLWLTQEEADKSEAERKREEEDEEDDDEDEDADTDDDDDDDDGDGDRDRRKKKAKKDEEPPPEVKIDWEDVADRIHTVATVRGYYWDYDASPDGKHYALRTDVVEEMELWTVDWDGDHLRRMTRGGANPRQLRWGEDSDVVRYISDGRLHEIENEADAKPTTLPFKIELTVDIHARRLQKFHEAWRLLNDGFYDSNFHGIDWPAMRVKYEELAAAAVMTEDFNDVVREMIGELNASHLGVYGGPRERGDDSTGLLGFTPDDDYSGPGVRVARVLRRGPLDRDGRRVTPGEVILAIDGQEIGPGENYYPLLNHQREKEVDLMVASDGAGTGARTITVEPTTGSRHRRLAYEQWTRENRRRVEELSNERVAYVHMAGMGDSNWPIFIEDIYSEAWGKDALLLDVRDNGGGSIHDRVLTFLSRRVYGYTESRSRRTTYNALERWDGPVVLLINERSYSDAEIFPWGFKALELGTVIGVPTFGAVIGTHDVELIDGTGFRIPSAGWYRQDGRNLENDAVQPHILVPSVPEENLRGQDVQLEAGLEECLRLLERE